METNNHWSQLEDNCKKKRLISFYNFQAHLCTTYRDLVYEKHRFSHLEKCWLSMSQPPCLVLCSLGERLMISSQKFKKILIPGSRSQVLISLVCGTAEALRL